LFSLSEENGLQGAIKDSDLEQANNFLQSVTAEHFGIIREMKDGKPYFIHRCFAEYFAAKWFSRKFSKCENFISNNLFNSTYEVTRNIFDRMLAEDSEIHVAVLNNSISALEKSLKNKKGINTEDKGGRTALHLAASYNSPLIQKLLSFPGVDANKEDLVLKWTPLRYAEKKKSWMAMDILLQNGAKTDDIVLRRRKSKRQEWGQAALWECASKGYRNLLEFMLKCGIDVHAVVEVPENIGEKNTLLHIASRYCQLEVIRILIQRKAHINIGDADGDTALHHAAISGNVEIIKILLDKEMSVDLTNAQNSTPLHLSALKGNLETTKTFVERGAVINNANKDCDTPVMLAASNGNLEIVRYLTEMGAEQSQRHCSIF
jgi:ankyrin repeat protein